MSSNKTKKIIFIVYFILLNTTILSQDFGIALKYNTELEGSYESYSSVSIDGSYLFFNEMFEIGPSFGFIYSELPFYITIPEYQFYSDATSIKKLFLGGSILFFISRNKFSPFIGIKGAILFDNVFENQKDRIIKHPGAYNYKSEDDYLYSLLGGIKIKTGVITIIFEAEYQQRKLSLEFDAYGFNGEKDEMYLNNMEINSLIGGIGLQFNF